MIELLEQAAEALGDLLDDVVFVGGATVSLWITDPAAPAPRPTNDVDVVVEVTSPLAFERFQERLRERFEEDADSGVICRWKSRKGPLLLDAMPARADLLGFENRWQGAAIPHAVERTLPSGATIRAVGPAFLVATKLEAFRGRGHGDHVMSHDFEDVVRLVDGREELVGEVEAAPADVQRYLADELSRVLSDPLAREAIAAHLPRDLASQERAEAVVVPRLERMIAAASR
ncbi:MAG TPA: nucleotidyl transferase AbiEii/AbiGii toxin family protein [Solirubrobacteraceae bacterium]|jgi:hypothetical protein|nr:nucleotidyl transferase AbiEii/AbiGii toxin family protein [Solirubrobacteraceae bacterium]